jgi:hypothetical protein
MGFLITKPQSKVIIVPELHESAPTTPRALQHPMLPQFHPGELQDLQSAVRTWLKAYQAHHNDETVARRKRMAPLLQKLEGMT